MQRLPAAQRQQKCMLMDVLQMHEQKHTPQLHWDTELHQSNDEIFLFILPVITSCKGEKKKMKPATYKGRMFRKTCCRSAFKTALELCSFLHIKLRLKEDTSMAQNCSSSNPNPWHSQPINVTCDQLGTLTGL